MQTSLSQSHKVLFLNTLSFTICFACWTMNGVLVAYLIDNNIFNWSVVQIGWLLGMPILSGAVLRLPAGILTDKFGGKVIFTWLLFICSIPLILLYFVNSYWVYLLLSLCFGMVGTSFAVGIAFTSAWYPTEWQGRALGIFGVGNAGAAFNTLVTPSILKWLSTNDPENGWRLLPVFYGIALIVMGFIFLFFVENKKTATKSKSIVQMLAPLKSTRVWRFGLYYFLVFGLFVTFSQWLLPYYINVYKSSLILAGLFASLFSLPSGIIRAFGGYLSDKFGARKVMYWVLTTSLIFSGLLILPKMEIFTPGKGISAAKKGTIELVTKDKVVLNGNELKLTQKPIISEEETVFPKSYSWQEAVVKQNQIIKKKELLVNGITMIKFSANMWVYTLLVILIGISWGIGKAAVYKHIPEYFPNEVGVVGGMVGLIGGLGGFIGPILFGYLLDFTGLWTSAWVFVFIISAICLYWMDSTIKKMADTNAPELKNKFEQN